MAAAIPDAELLEIPNASHTAPIEHPQLVNLAIRDFLGRRIERSLSSITDPIRSP
jgi:pimeloyl-ACP methyl ester carboxylesterase